jgi:TolA-binding protein
MTTLPTNIRAAALRAAAAGIAIAALAAGIVAAPAHAAEPPAAADPKLTEFEGVVRSIVQNPAAATEQQVLAMLTAATDLGRPYAATIAVKAWLARAGDPSPAVLLAAAENASLAGDLRTAASRYKLFIAASSDEQARSLAAARLYAILVDQLGRADDAYEFVARQGLELRQSAEAKKYDFWFLEQAQLRRDPVGMAPMLAAVMAEQMPLELERLTCWQRLDWLMAALVTAKPEQFAAVLPARKIVGLVRESPARAARYGFIVALLEYRANAVGKEGDALARAFSPVMAAAAAYVDAAPTAATLGDVQQVIATAVSHDFWKVQGGPIRDWWTASLPKLPDPEKSKAINWAGWSNYQASPEQWVELGVKFPEVFKESAGLVSLPLLVNKPDPAVFAAQSTFLTGVPSVAARQANAVAATKGTDLLAGFRHLSQQESWHGGFEDTFNAVGFVWSTWNGFPRQPAATQADFNKALLAWAPEAIARSPIALFHPAAVQQYLGVAFTATSADPNDKQAFVAALRSLDWVPWDEKARREAVTPAHNAFKQWANGVRTQLAALKKQKGKEQDAATLEAVAATIAPLEEEFKKAFDPAVSNAADLAKLADPLAGHLARCMRAVREKKRDDYVAAAKQAYAIIRDYREKRTPFGQPALAWLLTNRTDAFDINDFQCEVIADQMAAWEPGRPTAAYLAIDTALSSGRPGGANTNTPKDRRGAALAISATIGKGILAQLAKNQFEPRFFTRFRESRRGNGWQEQEIGKEVVAKLIDTKALLKTDQRIATRTAVADYQWLIRQEFQGLAAQYPPETFFDDMFLEESKARGWLSWDYFNYGGRDGKKKIANAAAEAFAGYTALAAGPAAPLGFDKLPPTLLVGDGGAGSPSGAIGWAFDEFWNWQGAAFGADPPLREKMVQAAEATWGKTRFDTIAMGRASITGDPAAIQAPEPRAGYFKKLAEYLERGKALRGRAGPPNVGAISRLEPKSLAAGEIATLLAMFDGNTPATWAGGNGYESLPALLGQSLLDGGRYTDLARIAPELWRIGRNCNNPPLYGTLATLAAAVSKSGNPDVAAGIADAGVEMLGTDLPEPVRSPLAALRNDLVLSLGVANPVPRGDPRWAVYDSQLSFTAGNFQSAWDRYSTNPAVVAQVYKELDPAYTTWLIRENTQVGNFDRARELGQLMLAWMDSTPGALDFESQAAVLVAYADIALARRDYPQARALYERIAAAKDFDGTAGKRDAELRVAEVDRLTRQFDAAKERLEKLTRRTDKTLQSEAYYQLALLKADQEEIEEAAGYLEQVFTRVPNHVNGRILEGRLNLLRRKYDVASKVKLGVLGDKKFLIPGKPLEVDLEDKNLAVVGKATQIEIRAWTAGGDEERFNLFPFGDSKTRFTGQIPTKLAAAVKGDHVLQVVGGDTVRYTFAESFGGAQDKLAEEPAAMTVVTDGDLLVSSGAILSKEEQENRALERMIRAKLQIGDSAERQMSLSTLRRDDQIKPGNAINVRVVDPDRGTTAGRDTLQVRATTASGDSLVVSLTETDAYTGVFEGPMPTGSSQATAYASDSTDGNDPNWPISPQGGTPWIAQADNIRPKLYSIDLNDNVALGRMTVTAAVPGRKLKDVYVQKSLNGRDFNTLGQWRSDGKATFVPWDGGPRMELVRFFNTSKPPVTVADFEEYLGRGRFAKGSSLLVEPVKKLAATLDSSLGKRSGALGIDGVTDAYVGHWRAGFVVPKTQARTFTLEPKTKDSKHARYVIAIDGKVGDKRDKPLTVGRSLQKGPHRIDVYAYVSNRHHAGGIDFEVLIDAPEAPFTAKIPEEFFDPAAHPEIADAFAVPAATVAASDDDTKLAVDFGKNVRGRVVRLLIADYETDAPAINAVTLDDADGRKVLPTTTSFLDLAKNGVLEIIPGDRITVGYDDPTVITPAKRTQERFLTATFTNAEVSAAFVEFAESAGQRQATYVPMRRFKTGDTVKVFINDPDMDTSDEPDRVPFTVRAGVGEPVSIEAIETENHSGVFLGTVFPVAGKPERPSEITVAAGEDLKLAYVDRENTDPGIPWERTGVVEQIGSEEPQLRVYDVASRPLDEKEREQAEQKQAKGRKLEELYPIRREIIAVRPEEPSRPDAPAKVLVDGPLLVEILAPRLAQSPRSIAELFVQTEAGRQALGRPVAEGEFPLDAPGTIRLGRFPGDESPNEVPPGVGGIVVRGNPYAIDALTDGRFTFLVRKELGPVPAQSLAEEKIDPMQRLNEPVLQVRGDDTVWLGFRHTDEAGEERWAVQPVALTSDVLFDVMDRRFQQEVDATFVGDSVSLRVIHPALDTTDEKDSVTVKVAASGGGGIDLPLTETFGHSGIFKGTLNLSYRDQTAPPAAGDKAAGAAAAGPTASEEARTLPVAYGESVALLYAPAAGDPLERTVNIFKGGDGNVVPFTKQFKEPEIAVQTQFTVAEAWFELAKRHRELGQESLARREIAQGKKLLEEAIRDYPNTELRAQADYLLANLSFEFSKEAANEEIARQHAMDAVTRFSDIVSSHPESEYAPKSQYKKALVLEKLGQIDQACEEYVKLSYRYPDNELVAETIARLGQYFLSKGKEFDEKASAQSDPVEREKVAIQGRQMFTTAAQVFGRLGERFPQHALASKTQLLSAQCYLRAKDFERSLEVFEAVYKNPKTEKELSAEAMYWAGDVSMQMKDLKSAYRAFKKVTWDYPESIWAKRARGRLTEESLVQQADKEEQQ